MNPQFQQIGETFVKQYYEIFDGDRDGREKLVNFYHVSRQQGMNEAEKIIYRQDVCKKMLYNGLLYVQKTDT